MAHNFSGPMGRFSLPSAPAAPAATRSSSFPGNSASPSPSPLPLFPPPPTSSSSAVPLWRRHSDPTSDRFVSQPTPAASWRSGIASDSWRTGLPPVKRPTKVYRVPNLGSVWHLPATPPSSDSVIFRKLDLAADQNPWGHPAVVVGHFVKDGKQCVKIRLCSSFNGQRIEDHKKPEQWQFHVLAENKEDEVPYPGGRLMTVVPGSGKFEKRTYINISPNSEYPIELANLVPWNGPLRLTFDAESTERIIKRVPW